VFVTLSYQISKNLFKVLFVILFGIDTFTILGEIKKYN
jgi:uncharacterized membrane protein